MYSTQVNSTVYSTESSYNSFHVQNPDWPSSGIPATSVDLTLSSRPSRGADANQQKLVTVRSYTENYCRQSYSIRTVKDWNALPQSVVSAGSLALFKSRLSSHVAP